MRPSPSGFGRTPPRRAEAAQERNQDNRPRPERPPTQQWDNKKLRNRPPNFFPPPSHKDEVMAVNLQIPSESDIFPVAGVEIGVTEAGIRKANRLDLTVFQFAAGTQVAGVFTRHR